MEVMYRLLKLEECNRISEIDATQYIGRAWREVNGIRQLVDINYQETELPNGFENHLRNLQKTIETGGVAIGAFIDDRLSGYISVNREFFGSKWRYVLLDQLFISNESRSHGIGKTLFLKASEIAKGWGADKFYICAGSAEETIAFYMAIGCTTAKEINEELYQIDTRDYQLEYEFK